MKNNLKVRASSDAMYVEQRESAPSNLGGWFNNPVLMFGNREGVEQFIEDLQRVAEEVWPSPIVSELFWDGPGFYKLTDGESHIDLSWHETRAGLRQEVLAQERRADPELSWQGWSAVLCE
jgi:hypothetical protein